MAKRKIDAKEVNWHGPSSWVGRWRTLHQSRRAWLSILSATLMAGCVSTPVNPPNATLVVGYEWQNPPRWLGGGMYISVYPFDRTTGAAGRKFVPSGQAHAHLEVAGKRTGAKPYQAVDLVAGDYVIGHVDIIAADNEVKWLCPPIAFTIRPGTKSYLGDLVFDGFDFVDLAAEEDRLADAKKFYSESVVAIERIDGKINYEKYTNPGFIGGTPQNPCRSAES